MSRMSGMSGKGGPLCAEVSSLLVLGGFDPCAIQSFMFYPRGDRSNSAQRCLTTKTGRRSRVQGGLSSSILILDLSPGPLLRHTPLCCAPQHDRARSGRRSGCTQGGKVGEREVLLVHLPSLGGMVGIHPPSSLPGWYTRLSSHHPEVYQALFPPP